MAARKKRIVDILNSDRYDAIVEKEVRNRRGAVYLPESVGKTIIVVILDPSLEKDPAGKGGHGKGLGCPPDRKQTVVM